jgi:hypothetical protein
MEHAVEVVHAEGLGEPFDAEQWVGTHDLSSKLRVDELLGVGVLRILEHLVG